MLRGWFLLSSASFTLLSKVAYIFMALSLLGITTSGIASSYGKLQVDIDNYNKERYKKMTILQNMLALDLTRSELNAAVTSDDQWSAYSYQRQTAIIPMEYFAESREGQTVGYKVNNGHCYIENIPALDGENYAFKIRRMDEWREDENQRRTFGCNGDLPSFPLGGQPVSAPALIIRRGWENPPMPARIWVYQVNG